MVDLGAVPPEARSSCNADYAVLTYYDLYLKEAERFPHEVAAYRQVLGAGRTVALFKPEPGHVGGPTVRIVAIR